MSVIADVCYNGMKGYSWKYTIGDMAITRKTEYDYIEIYNIMVKKVKLSL
jgi:hypothetical protein